MTGCSIIGAAKRVVSEMGLLGERRGCPYSPGFGCGAMVRRSMTAEELVMRGKSGSVSSFY